MVVPQTPDPKRVPHATALKWRLGHRHVLEVVGTETEQWVRQQVRPHPCAVGAWTWPFR